VPSQLGGLANLLILALEGNSKLTGEMPGEICSLASNNKLNTLSLDCAAVQCSNAACVGEAGSVCICPTEEESGGGGGGDDGFDERR